MKIIKRGKLPSERIWRGTCPNCKSVVEAKESELTIASHQRDGTYALALCPVCQVGGITKSTQMYFYPIQIDNV